MHTIEANIIVKGSCWDLSSHALTHARTVFPHFIEAIHSNKKLVETSALLVVTGALLVGARTLLVTSASLLRKPPCISTLVTRVKPRVTPPQGLSWMRRPLPPPPLPPRWSTVLQCPTRGTTRSGTRRWPSPRSAPPSAWSWRMHPRSRSSSTAGNAQWERPIAPFVAMPGAPSSFLLLVAMPFAPSSVLLLLVARPRAPTGVLAPRWETWWLVLQAVAVQVMIAKPPRKKMMKRRRRKRRRKITRNVNGLWLFCEHSS